MPTLNYKFDDSPDISSYDMNEDLTNQKEWPSWLVNATKIPKHLPGSLYYTADNDLYLNVCGFHRQVIPGDCLLKGKGKLISALPSGLVCADYFTVK